MATFIELSDIPVIDNHCHAVEALLSTDLATWREQFTESPDPTIGAEHVSNSAFYRRLIRRMRDFYGIDDGSETEEALLAHRAELGTELLVEKLFRDANIGSVVIDTGYPAADKAMKPADLVSASGSRYAALLRLEVTFQTLIADSASYDELVAAARDLVSDVRGAGYVGFKSIAAYRTGLAIDRWSDAEAREAFAGARAEVERTGAVRLGYKPLLDTLLHCAFEAAAEQELPVQFHVGYGDPDVDIRAASPLELRNLFEEPAYLGMPIVMLHGCWPYFREGAYLAAVYRNAYLDISYSIPFLSAPEMTSMTRAALGTAPHSKVMYSSDAVGIPEMHWMGAIEGRKALGITLGELVDFGELSEDEARDAGELILNANAARVYGLDGTDGP